jgi:hypothetical protein
MDRMEDDPSLAATAPDLERLGASLGDLHAIVCEARPTQIEAAISGRILTCVMEDGLTSQERHLIELGHGVKVRAFREEMFRAAGDYLTSVVETHMRRSVNAWVPAFEPQTSLTTLVFVLDVGPQRDPQPPAS